MKNLNLISIIFLIFLTILLESSHALAWTVAPVRFQVKAEKGKEYTFTFSVLNESQLYQKRFEVQTDEWVIDKNNNFLRKAFNKEVDNNYSAASWIKVTPQQFVVSPGETKNVRFTVTVPNNLASDGEYSAGIFVGEKNIEKPPKGEKIVHIKQDTFIGVIVYVRVGQEKSEVALKDLVIESKSVAKGLNKVIVLPKFESHGNVHSRAQISVKMEPELEVDSKALQEEFNGGEVVVPRGSEVIFPIEVPKPLPANSEWRFTVSADFGKNTPLIVGRKKYKIPNIEIPTQKKQETKRN